MQATELTIQGCHKALQSTFAFRFTCSTHRVSHKKTSVTLLTTALRSKNKQIAFKSSKFLATSRPQCNEIAEAHVAERLPACLARLRLRACPQVIGSAMQASKAGCLDSSECSSRGVWAPRGAPPPLHCVAGPQGGTACPCCPGPPPCRPCFSTTGQSFSCLPSLCFALKFVCLLCTADESAGCCSSFRQGFDHCLLVMLLPVLLLLTLQLLLLLPLLMLMLVSAEGSLVWAQIFFFMLTRNLALDERHTSKCFLKIYSKHTIQRHASNTTRFKTRKPSTWHSMPMALTDV